MHGYSVHGSRSAGCPLGKTLTLALSGSLVLGLTPPGAAVAFAADGASAPSAVKSDAASADEDSDTGTDDELTLTRDSDGFFAALSSDGKAGFDTKIALSDLEKLGIYFSDSDARDDGVSDTHVAKSGAGTLNSPVTNGSTDGASISYSTLYTVTVDSQTFERGARLRYTNNNGAEVSYNERDVIQAVLYAISEKTQDPDFDGKTMYRVRVDYGGTIDLTNEIFVYSNTWLELGEDTVMKKQFQGNGVDSALADRAEARKRAIAFTNENILRNTAGEFGQGGYGQSRNIVIEGGTWDANIEHYNRARLGDAYQSSATKFSHMKNLAVRDTTIKGANLAHHLELSGVRDVTVTGSTFTGYDGATDKEAIQVETLHSKGSTRECAPFDDTPTRDIVIYDNTFSDCCRGIGNHAYVLGLDSTRIYVYKNVFRNLSAQAVLTTGCRDMRIEDNTMANVGTGVDVRVTKYNNGTNVSMPVYEDWTYDELVDNGFLNRNIKIIGNNITATGGSSLNATDCTGVAISVKGQTISAGNTKVVTRAAGSYTISGVTIRGNTIMSATGTAIRFYNTKGCTLANNTVLRVGEYDGRAIGLYVTKTAGLAASGNGFYNCAKRGAYLVESNGLELTGNTFSGLGADGIYASGVSSLEVENNELSNVGGNGIALVKSKASLIRGNEISRVSANGISLSNASGKAAVTGNKVDGASKSGIFVSKSNNVTLTGNSLSGIGGYGVSLSGASKQASIARNVIKMPTGKPGVYATGGAKGTATGNTIWTSGHMAIVLGGSRTRAFTIAKTTRRKVKGTTAARTRVTAYAKGKQLGTALSGKEGAFAVKLKKKQRKGSAVQLRRTDASGNSIRRNVRL